MNHFVYTQNQLKTFCEDFPRVFADSGFEIVEEPYIDYGLCGFRATFIRRYLLHQPTSLNDGILTTIVHTVGIPFGSGQKMVVLSAPRNLKNEPVCETLKLRIHFERDGTPYVVQNDQAQRQDEEGKQAPRSNIAISNKDTPQDLSSQDKYVSCFDDDFCLDQRNALSIFRKLNSSYRTDWTGSQNRRFIHDLTKYVLHIIEVVSPGLIDLPFEMKLEILKQLSVDSIIKMSQVNNEFRALIFKHGESLWRHLCNRDFKIKYINRSIHKSWMELYRDTYLLHQNEILRKERALPGLPERLALPPVPYRYQIEWLPEVLALPFHPLRNIALPENHPILALEFHPMRRAASLDSLP